jgi:two-component system NtrC family sensor kinase
MNNKIEATAPAAIMACPAGRMTPLLSEFIDENPMPTFAIDADHVITHWNKACEQALGKPAAEMVGTRNQWQPFYPEPRPILADLIVDGKLAEMADVYYPHQLRRAPMIPGAWEAEEFFPRQDETGRWIFFSAAPLHDRQGKIVGAVEVLQDVTQKRLAELDPQRTQLDLERLVEKRTAQLAEANRRLEEDIRQREKTDTELHCRNAELTALNEQYSRAQEQLVQSEKLASIGQLAAGVAHEINNPVGYIFSNFGTLEIYLQSLFEMLAAYEEAEQNVSAPEVVERLKNMRERVELDFLKEDIPILMRESKEGIVRVRKIVQDLKDFSRVESTQEWQWANLHDGIDSTLNIVTNETKYKADIIRNYGNIPNIECLPSQINQVVMNLVVNAAHAIGPERGTITISTGAEGANVWIEVADTGSGIPKESLSRIFDPFYTSKPVGKGTGLGLSLSYGIVQKHHGRIDVDTEVGKGTRFRVTLPVRHPAPTEQDEDH